MSTSGKVTTTGTLVADTYTATGTLTDAYGDTGTFTFKVQVLQPLSPATVKIRSGTSTTIVGKSTAASGTKVTVDVSKSGKLIKKGSTTVKPNGRILYGTGVLTTGTYKVQFVVAGTLVKTTTVDVTK